MKSILLTTFLFLLSFSSFSQNWQEVKKNNAVTISVKEIHYQNKTDDIDHQRLVFKYENTTSSPIEIHFNRELTYNGKTLTQDQDFSINIPANGTVQYDDSKSNDKTYYIFKKDNKGWIKGTLDTYTIIHLK